MSIISPVMCLTGRHRPLRRNVEWNGKTYVGQCRHCGRDIHRIAHRNWKTQNA